MEDVMVLDAETEPSQVLIVWTVEGKRWTTSSWQVEGVLIV
jgi:hypothetical protein